MKDSMVHHQQEKKFKNTLEKLAHLDEIKIVAAIEEIKVSNDLVKCISEKDSIPKEDVEILTKGFREGDKNSEAAQLLELAHEQGVGYDYSKRSKVDLDKEINQLDSPPKSPSIVTKPPPVGDYNLRHRGYNLRPRPSKVMKPVNAGVKAHSKK